nr:PBP1A family penicillin-binding protein [Tardibacter chloracetimidivorans]
MIALSSLPGYEEMRASPNGQMVRVLSRDGSVIASVGPSYGEWLSHDEIPPVMIDAMVAVEDRRFYGHPGVDPIGIARAAWVNFSRGGNYQGASTITQQLARNIFLTNARKFARKFREVILAMAMERKFSKEQILELYLNRVYFGGGAYGIDAASRRFFGHSATRLSLEEAAIIAGLVKAPSRYAPSADPEAARGRAQVVIRLMKETGKISAATANMADPRNAKIAPQPRQNSVRYFTDWALAQLDEYVGDTSQPLNVTTTLDLGMQKAADEAIDRFTPRGAQGALVAMSNDGAVRAMVGGKDYVTSIYNRATQAQRQPGSAFKLFVYLAALEDGATPDDLVVDQPITIDGWTPRNYSRGHMGEVTLRQAFAFSLNTVAAKLGQYVGYGRVADMARRFGITTPVNTHPSMVLGTSDVRLIDMTRAFASVANGGGAAVPYGISRITTGAGEVLYERTPAEPRVLVAPWVAASMTDLLKAAVETGTGRAAQIGRPLAGKTGTTSSNRDGWFLGFTGNLTAGVWMGRDDARPVAGLQGGRAPATAFAAFMRQATSDIPVSELTTSFDLPGNQMEPDDEVYGIIENGVSTGQLVDPDGMPIDGSQRMEDQPVDPRLDQQWLDRVLSDQYQPARPTQ